MKKMTSAFANKIIRQLQEEKRLLVVNENEGATYIATNEEEAVIPDYNYSDTSKMVEEIDEKICRIKHAINLSNSVNTIDVNGKEMTIDTVLVKMAQLNSRKETLDELRKNQAVVRISNVYRGSGAYTPEYMYINYDLREVKEDYKRLSNRIMEMQLALDRYNQIVEFEVDI